MSKEKEEWEKTFYSIPDMIAILDADHNIVRVNPAMADVLGCAPDKCEGLKCHTAVHGTDCPPEFCPHAKTLIDGREHTAEIYEERIGKHLLVTTTPLHDDNGRMTGSVHIARDITEQKETEERIKNIALFPEENPFPVLRVSGDGMVLYANRASAKLLEHWQCSIGTSVPAPVHAKLHTALTKAANQEILVRYDMCYMSLVLVPIPERDYVNFYSRDITEQKSIETALRQRETDLKRAQTVAHIGSWHMDIENNQLLWSDETYHIFRIPKKTPMTYDTFIASVHPDDRNYVKRSWEETLNGAPYDIEHRIVTGNTVKWVRERAELEFDKDGQLTGGFGTVQDITERKHNDILLTRSLRRFELLSHVAGDLLQNHNPHKIVENLCQKVMEHLDCHVFFNFMVDDTVKRLRLNAYVGIPPEEAEKIEWLDYGVAVCGCAARDGCRIVSEHIPGTDDPKTELVKSYGIKAYACHPLLVAGGNVIGTLSFGTKNRDTFSEDELSLMKAVADQVAVAMARIQNEQALRKSEEALLNANADLEQKVMERTEDLTGTVKNLRNEIEQRLKAEEKLRTANELLEKQANQLRILAGELTMAEHRERKRIASILHDDLQQQLALVKLKVSCLDLTDRSTFSTATKDIENLLVDTINTSRTLTAELSPPILHETGLKGGLEWLVKWKANKYGLKINLSAEENIPELEEDLKTMLLGSTRELVFNAIKHAQVDSLSIDLKMVDGRNLQISVCDSGLGFDPQKIKTAGETGAGYGLFSISERLVLFSGNLEIDSAPGKGSRFIITVPVTQYEPEPEPVAAMKGSVAGVESLPVDQKPGKKISVLVVDDHTMMREGVISMLKFEPDVEIAGEAKDGYEAIEKACSLMPDVILMDINMPVLNGINATRAIHEKYPDIFIIGLSMYEEDESTEAIQNAGAVAYLTKSGPREDLVAAIRKCMKK